MCDDAKGIEIVVFRWSQYTKIDNCQREVEKISWARLQGRFVTITVTN